ncbi:S-methyl-5'-thioinosine phosphorylase [Caloramator mitchellensis]|uniref:Probable 6-oxopurine nucleoside phosphorylase n=1 Tax=Caloramator mitchellensis TaxID=908809 RepID=A0A0R3JX52_CALMK|nr:S-methyl-5'-thioadenosine phosphorylase [Caloramator mitchellensis]KRQ88115.1 S-methyl-5'-thioinosine phosphorylase [Caloramator mitchellensis]
MKKIAIIGGTGVYSPDIFENLNEIQVNTPYGNVNIIESTYKESIVYFLERHGKGHKLPPHKINYRANIWALKMLNVDRVLSTAAVGSLDKIYPPGAFVIIDQFIDFTKQRPLTFFEGDSGVVHVDMTNPYCIDTREHILKVCQDLNIIHFDKGTYVCTEGPRFETPAEIKMYKMLGADVVGMTNVPEVILAREANLCYATVAMVTNYAAGISESALTHKEVTDNMVNMADNIKRLFLRVIETIPIEKKCNCKYSTQELGNLK